MSDQIITPRSSKNNSQTSNESKIANTASLLPTELTSEIIQTAIQINSKKHTKNLFNLFDLVFDLLERGGFCKAKLVADGKRRSLSVMLGERIGKVLGKTRMKELSKGLELFGLKRARNNNYGCYGYIPTALAYALRALRRHRLEKSDPVILKKRPSLSKSFNEEIKKEIKINESVGNNPKPTPKTVDIDLDKKLIIDLIAREARTRRQTIVKWVNRYGLEGVRDIFKRCKQYSPDRLGAYMFQTFRKTPPTRIDVECLTSSRPTLNFTENERANIKIPNLREFLAPKTLNTN